MAKGAQIGTRWARNRRVRGGYLYPFIPAEAARTAATIWTDWYFPNQLSGFASIVDGDDSVTATGILPLIASATITEAADLSAGAAAILITGQSAVTEGNDTVAGTAVLRIAGTSSATEANDSVSSAGAVAVRGTVAVSEAADLAAGAAGVRIAGAAAIVEANDAVTALAALPAQAAAIIDEGDDAVASVAALRLVGGLDIVEEGDTAVATVAVFVVMPTPPSRTFASPKRETSVGNEPRTRSIGSRARKRAA